MTQQDPDKYLAVLKASYDYQPQSEDEIEIKEDQLLLLLDKVDDESVPPLLHPTPAYLIITPFQVVESQD